MENPLLTIIFSINSETMLLILGKFCGRWSLGSTPTGPGFKTFDYYLVGGTYLVGTLINSVQGTLSRSINQFCDRNQEKIEQQKEDHIQKSFNWQPRENRALNHDFILISRCLGRGARDELIRFDSVCIVMNLKSIFLSRVSYIYFPLFPSLSSLKKVVKLACTKCAVQKLNPSST